MQDRLMQEVRDEIAKAKRKALLRAEAEEIRDARGPFADNREGRRAAQRATRKRNGYTR